MSRPTVPTGKLIRVFIASTFEDMHQDRDHLVNEVFPRLRERCRGRGVELRELDLRWGVTEDAVSTDMAADVCLDNVDACRPYFIAMLGHRYGAPSVVEGRSITEREIRHATFHVFLPSRFPDLEAVLDGPLNPPASSAAEREALHRCYAKDWETGTYVLTDGADPDDQEIVRGLFKRHPHYAMPRTIFFLRTRDFTTKLASMHAHPFFEKDEVAERHINALRGLVKESGLLCFEYDDMEALGLRLEDQLWKWLLTDLGDGPAELDERAAEARSQELFMLERTRSFVGRNAILDHVLSLCAAPEPSTVIVTGPPGVGKSALLGRMAQQAREEHSNWIVVPHFVGASVSSSNLRRLLSRLCQQFLPADAELPEEPEKLRKEFCTIVDAVDPTAQFVFLLDGLDQLENTDSAHDMQWLPLAPPPNVTFVVSANRGPVLDALIARKRSLELVELPALDEKESRHLVYEYLRKMRHDFPNAAVERTFFSRIRKQLPLYICVAIEELRVYGRYDELQQRVGALPDDLPGLFDQVLKRLGTNGVKSMVDPCC
ncbi:MAG: DUF4062 domain-containing protein [Deltaproteobacteria bacterium]|nr:DUF4062 domain-containing protein [Deltaproteobacteria bacterium]